MQNLKLILAASAIALMAGPAFAASDATTSDPAQAAPASDSAATTAPRQASSDEYPGGKPDNGDINDPDQSPNVKRGPDVVPPDAGAGHR